MWERFKQKHSLIFLLYLICMFSRLFRKANLIKEFITHHTHTHCKGCSVVLTVLTQPYYCILQTTGTRPVEKPHTFRHLPRKWRFHEKEIELRDMDVGVLAGGLRWTDIQRYSLSSVSFVPSGGGVCLQKYLKVRQEKVSRGAEALLCYDNKEQTFITPNPAVNMRTLM